MIYILIPACFFLFTRWKLAEYELKELTIDYKALILKYKGEKDEAQF
jgi:hypothetical protein